jgi:hypothetical protein
MPFIRCNMVVDRLQWPTFDKLQAALRQQPQAGIPAAASGWMYFDGDGDSVEVGCIIGPGTWSTCAHQRHGPPCHWTANCSQPAACAVHDLNSLQRTVNGRCQTLRATSSASVLFPCRHHLLMV